MTYGEYLKVLRLLVRKSQKDVAIAAYTSQAMVSRWEKGKSVPNLSHLPGLSKALGVKEHHLTYEGYKSFRDEYEYLLDNYKLVS